ncbi:hypothetical protein [Micromonospora sp. LOL_024]|uniref:hypothetical protein n=1 Tax=Micromonospora sp. LOL_024 TaxID=3345412 RepID=UPI003A89A637
MSHLCRPTPTGHNGYSSQSVTQISLQASGRVSIAGLTCYRPGQRSRFIYRTITHRGRKNERRSFSERDYIALLDAAHQQLGGPVVCVWDNLNVRHEASSIRAGMEGPRRRSVAADRLKLGAAVSRGRGMRWEAAPTTPGRAGTARRCGFGKRDEKLYARNQCLTPRNCLAGSNLADLGRDAAHATGCGGDSEAGVFKAGGEATVKVCGVVVAMLSGYSWTAPSSTG